MTIHDATEVAYKNGYEAGKRDAQKWIPVTEHTAPERFVNVLCYFPQKDYGSKTQVSYNECEKGELPYFSEQHQWGAPSHWMPLPEPPKEDA